MRQTGLTFMNKYFTVATAVVIVLITINYYNNYRSYCNNETVVCPVSLWLGWIPETFPWRISVTDNTYSPIFGLLEEVCNHDNSQGCTIFKFTLCPLSRHFFPKCEPKCELKGQTTIYRGHRPNLPEINFGGNFSLLLTKLTTSPEN